MPSFVLELEGLSARYGEAQALRGVAEKLTGIAVVTVGPSEGCSTRRKKPVSRR